jgi:DNA-binding NtrC family response regulator
VDVLSRELRQRSRDVSPEAMRALESYSWPGNARELKNGLERVLLLEDCDTILVDHLPSEIQGTAARGERALCCPRPASISRSWNASLSALDRADGNKGAARLLGLSRDTMRYRLQKHGIRCCGLRPTVLPGQPPAPVSPTAAPFVRLRSGSTCDGASRSGRA